MNIYEFDSYKDVLTGKVNENKAKGSGPVTFQDLAERSRIQKTYLSRVLKHDAHLSTDQLYLACEALALSDDEREYLSLLHAENTSAVSQRKRGIQAQITHLQTRHARTEKHAHVTAIQDSEMMSDYYLDPLFTLVHIFLTIDHYALHFQEIAKQVQISSAKLREILDGLERMGIIFFHQGRYRIKKDDVHLPADSKLQGQHRTSMRLKALEQMSLLMKDEFYSFSVVFSSQPKIQKKIQARFMDFLKETQSLVKAGTEQNVYQLNFDFLPWSP